MAVDQVVPPSVENSYDVTVPDGAVKVTESCELEPVTALAEGDVGAASTVVPAKVEVAAPAPSALTARIFSAVYAVLALRPVRSIDVAVTVVALNQVLLPSRWNS